MFYSTFLSVLDKCKELSMDMSAEQTNKEVDVKPN